MSLNGLTDTIKTDNGYHLIRYAVVAEIEVIKRDDLRGIWQVEDNEKVWFYPDRETAFAAAEGMLDLATQEPPEPEDSEPEHPSGTMIG